MCLGPMCVLWRSRVSAGAVLICLNVLGAAHSVNAASPAASAPAAATSVPAASTAAVITDLATRPLEAPAIEDMVGAGMLQLQSAGLFNPNGVFTRGDFATASQRLFGLTKPSQVYAFADVPPTSPIYDAVEAAAPYMNIKILCLGCLLGHNFSPNAPLGRAHAAIALVRMLVAAKKLQLVDQREVDADLSGVADAASLPAAARPYIATAIKNGVVSLVTGGKFAPATTYDRGDIAVVLDNVQKKFNPHP